MGHETSNAARPCPVFFYLRKMNEVVPVFIFTSPLDHAWVWSHTQTTLSRPKIRQAPETAQRMFSCTWGRVKIGWTKHQEKCHVLMRFVLSLSCESYVTFYLVGSDGLRCLTQTGRFSGPKNHGGWRQLPDQAIASHCGMRSCQVEKKTDSMGNHSPSY